MHLQGAGMYIRLCIMHLRNTSWLQDLCLEDANTRAPGPCSVLALGDGSDGASTGMSSCNGTRPASSLTFITRHCHCGTKTPSMPDTTALYA